jgi:predicted PurR-regulated permease PerM
MRTLEDKTFLFLLIGVSLAFALIVWQFYGAVLWAVVIAVVFAPLHRQLLQSMRPGRRNLAALTAVAIIVVIVILPLAVLAAALVDQTSLVFESIQAGELNLGGYYQRVLNVLPSWTTQWLDRFGLTNIEFIQQRLSTALVGASQFLAAQILSIGQNTAEFLVNLFVMLYLLFFLFRDGGALAARIKQATPLRPEQNRALTEKFTLVIRATVKGNIIVALVQGALGGLMFWFLNIPAALLWAVLMTVLSLLPAVGSAIVWLPVAIYLIATGSIWQGVILIAYGALVIGLIDNLLRPILVGKDTRMPDYVVLISTLGGLVIFGMNGFVMGPLIAAMFITVWDIFSESKHKH